MEWQAAHETRHDLLARLAIVPLVLGTTVGVLLMAYVALRLSSPLGRLLGQTGANVVTRVLGVLLAALAVQYVADGVRGLLLAGGRGA